MHTHAYRPEYVIAMVSNNCLCLRLMYKSIFPFLSKHISSPYCTIINILVSSNLLDKKRTH